MFQILTLTKGLNILSKKFMGSIVLFNYEEEDKGPKLLGQEGKDSFEIIFKEIQNELNMIESKKGTFALFLDYTSMDSNAYSDNRSSILHTVNPNFVNNTTQISEEARREFWKTSSTCVNICLGKISSDQPLQLARYRSRKYEKGYQKRIW
ncbi:predicted protein [Chaetoceros tenuissimus]|uniref:Uncharacterized protein n=1 Tax=Chaetoceros tenuissimus TaxID=426638 RepID=A0AAD3HAR1_9STRA|nr:predicted protein [Chaetoceros tenuissimus]